ncbi:MAG TPA: glutamate 2,3-aminomutase [Clostridiales bacterium]|nr:glutamate 2,3-aminomutase [Clostridiales bacterium]
MEERLSSRQVSLQRAAELAGKASEYLEAKKRIPKGIEMQQAFNASKQKLLEHFRAGEEDWNNWKWQLNHIINDVNTLSKVINLTDEDKHELTVLSQKYRWAVSPYYASLMDPDDPFDPIRLMGLPSMAELADTTGEMDPMGEEFTNPAGSITRRYPDRLIINVTNQCANYCRFCQRRRNIGQVDRHKSKKVLQESIDYIKENPEIRDVLITGGDSLMLENNVLEWLISSIRAIPHVEIIRLGTRSIVTLPQRITPQLCSMLKKYHPIYINTHFNHPKEITRDAKRAAEMLADSGIPLGNQMVLLNGVNNDKYIVQCLNHELLKIRVRPYYIFHPKQVKGTSHFLCSVDEGIEIMEHLRGRTSGMAIPTYIINAPGGAGKTPVLPTYLVSRGHNTVTFRTWEGKIFKYKNPPTVDIKKAIKNARKYMREADAIAE